MENVERISYHIILTPILVDGMHNISQCILKVTSESEKYE